MQKSLVKMDTFTDVLKGSQYSTQQNYCVKFVHEGSDYNELLTRQDVSASLCHFGFGLDFPHVISTEEHVIITVVCIHVAYE